MRFLVGLVCALGAVLLVSAPAVADAVTINGTFASARVIVHELPNDGAKARAVRFVESFRDSFFPDAEIIDATAVTADELRTRLANGFVLFGTFHDGSDLLRQTVEPLGITVDGDTMRFRDASVPRATGRLICVGRNPYASGRVVVYAAGSTAGVVGINEVFHGPHSYHLFSGKELVSEGDYDATFRFAARRLPLSDAVADVEQLFASAERVHPDLLSKMTFADYSDLRKWTVDEIGRRLDAEGTIGIRDLAFVLYRTLAAFGDGHTSLHWSKVVNQENSQGVRFPPFVIEFRENAFWIAGAGDPAIVGSRIDTVDGAPAETFLRPILERCSGEILAFKASRFVNKQPFWWWLTKALEGHDELVLSTVDGAGVATTRRLPTSDYDAFAELVRTWRRGRPERPQGGLTYHDGGRIAHFVYSSFVLSDGEKTRIDGVFRELHAKQAEDLILDIRGNSGGNSEMGELILSYLTDRPFRSFSKVRVKVSPESQATYADERRFAGHEGLIVTYRVEEKSRVRPETPFGGRVTLLVDNATFSSAADFAVMFRDYEIGEIVGYETGGLPISFGDVLTLSLDNSRIPYGVSYKQFFGPRPRPGDDEHGVIPDIVGTRELLTPHRGAQDPLLDFVVDRLAKTRP